MCHGMGLTASAVGERITLELSAAASASGPMPEPADRRSAVQLWVLLVAQRRYTGSRMPAPQRQRLGCGGCMDGRAEQGSSQAAEKR